MGVTVGIDDTNNDCILCHIGTEYIPVIILNRGVKWRYHGQHITLSATFYKRGMTLLNIVGAGTQLYIRGGVEIRCKYLHSIVFSLSIHIICDIAVTY